MATAWVCSRYPLKVGHERLAFTVSTLNGGTGILLVAESAHTLQTRMAHHWLWTARQCPCSPPQARAQSLPQPTDISPLHPPPLQQAAMHARYPGYGAALLSALRLALSTLAAWQRAR